MNTGLAIDEINRKKTSLFLSLIALRIVIDLSYIFFINPYYAYSGFKIDFNISTYLYSWFIFLLPTFVIKTSINKISDFFFCAFICFVIAPLTSLTGLSDNSLYPSILTIISFFIVYLISDYNIKIISKKLYLKNGDKYALIISVCMVIYLTSWYFISGAAFNANFDYSKIYEYREINSQLVNKKILAYINNWTYQVCTLFLMSYFLLKQKYLYFIIVLFFQMFFFSVSSHKSIFLTPFLIFGIFLFFRKKPETTTISYLLMATVVSCVLFFYITNNIIPASTLVRRLLFIPALLTFEYFDFFSKNPNVYWSNSVLSNLINYPYDISVPELIGRSSKLGDYANNNFISSGYAHAKYIGVIFYSILLGFILRLIDYVSSGKNPLWFSLSIVIIPLSNTLLSSDLFISLNTHGLLLSMVFLFFVYKKSYKSE